MPEITDLNDKILRDLKYIQADYYGTGKRTYEDYTGLYTISIAGNIYDSQGNRLEEKKFKGYRCVYLKDRNGKEHRRLIHRAVASTYTDICGEVNEVVHHKDFEKTNCSAFNLMWCSNLNNLAYGGKTKGRKKKVLVEPELEHIKEIPEIDWKIMKSKLINV